MLDLRNDLCCGVTSQHVTSVTISTVAVIKTSGKWFSRVEAPKIHFCWWNLSRMILLEVCISHCNSVVYTVMVRDNWLGPT